MNVERRAPRTAGRRDREIAPFSLDPPSPGTTIVHLRRSDLIEPQSRPSRKRASCVRFGSDVRSAPGRIDVSPTPRALCALAYGIARAGAASCVRAGNEREGRHMRYVIATGLLASDCLGAMQGVVSGASRESRTTSTARAINWLPHWRFREPRYATRTHRVAQ
jgi:hypothetical protein